MQDAAPQGGPGNPLCRTGMRLELALDLPESWLQCLVLPGSRVELTAASLAPHTFLGTLVMMGLGRVLKRSLVLMRAVTV